MSVETSGDWKKYESFVNMIVGLFRPKQMLKKVSPRVKDIIKESSKNTYPNASLTLLWKEGNTPYHDTGRLMNSMEEDVSGEELNIGWNDLAAYILDVQERGAAIPVTNAMRKWLAHPDRDPPIYLRNETKYIIIPARMMGRKASNRISRELPEIVGDTISDVVRVSFTK